MREFNIDLAGLKWEQVDDYLKALCANVTVAKDKAVCNAVVLLYGEGVSAIILCVIMVIATTTTTTTINATTTNVTTTINATTTTTTTTTTINSTLCIINHDYVRLSISGVACVTSTAVVENLIDLE